jgi:hypothetical protein
VESLGTRVQLLDEGGWEVGQYYNYSPRSIVVCGTHAEFTQDDQENEGMFSSFELYRRNLVVPEILTFDELLERASSIVRGSESPG